MIILLKCNLNTQKKQPQENHEHHHEHHHITVDNISVISNVSEVMEGDEEKRETWTGKFDFFLSALGYAGKIKLFHSTLTYINKI